MQNQLIIIHFNGVGYCYTTESGVQLTKYYSTVNKLRKYGFIKK